MIEPGYAGIHPIFRARIATNLANQLDYLGRQVEAVEHWDIALHAIPNFAMAHGNRGIGLIHLARGLYDEKHGAGETGYGVSWLLRAPPRGLTSDYGAGSTGIQTSFRRRNQSVQGGLYRASEATPIER